MTGFDAGERALLSAGSRLSELETEIQQSFATLHLDADTLLDGGWAGGTASAFREGWQQWVAGYNDCMNVLAEMGQKLQTNGQGYGGAEQTSVSVINGSGAGFV